jgi:IS5 family transposase
MSYRTPHSFLTRLAWSHCIPFPRNTARSGGSGIDARTTRHAGYAISQRLRKRVEEIFGRMKTVGGFRKSRYRGIAHTGFAGYMVAAAYDLVRMSRLLRLSTA